MNNNMHTRYTRTLESVCILCFIYCVQPHYWSQNFFELDWINTENILSMCKYQFEKDKLFKALSVPMNYGTSPYH